METVNHAHAKTLGYNLYQGEPCNQPIRTLHCIKRLINGRTSGRPLANPPGGPYPQVDLTLEWTCCRPRQSLPWTQKSAVDPPRVCGGTVDFLVFKKPRKVCQLLKESESVRHGLFCFWRTILVDKSLIVCSGFTKVRVRIRV